MNEKRDDAAGITYKNKFHVFGGSDGSRSKTTELISIDGGVEDGPELPEAVYGGDGIMVFHHLHKLNSLTPVWRKDRCHLLLSPNMVH